MHNDPVKLPKLEIQKFDFSPACWQEFIDSLNAAVHNSRSLPNIDKFNYLQGFCEGEVQHTNLVLFLPVHSLVVSDLHLETKGSWFESGCHLYPEVDSPVIAGLSSECLMSWVEVVERS